MSDNYTEEIQPLYKLLKNEDAFRFVIVQHNHFSLVRRLQEDLQQKFPAQKSVRLNAEKTNIQEILETYDALEKGFLFIENFEDILKESRSSSGEETAALAILNDRRQNITRGLNLRRDRLTKSPIALILFVSTTAGKLYAKTLMEKMPDLWSFRSWILELEMRQEALATDVNRAIETTTENSPSSTLGGTDKRNKLTELNRLLTNLQETDITEVGLRKTLYPQIIELLKEVGQYQNALIYLEEWYALGDAEKQAEILFSVGDIYRILGNLNASENAIKKVLKTLKKTGDKNFIGLCYDRLGVIYESKGDFNIALNYFEKYHKIETDLVKNFPNIYSYKINLATSYERLGQIQINLGNLKKALEYFEVYFRLSKELYSINQEDVRFKDDLAISYEKLGTVHSNLGNWKKALEYFDENLKLRKELDKDYSDNINYKIRLALSYGKLGSSQINLGNTEKALGNFEKYSRLSKDLYTEYPENVSFKEHLAASYLKLCSIQSNQQNWSIAEEYCKKSTKLFEELYTSYPDNINFKNGLAVSFWTLGDFYRTHKDKVNAKLYFEKCHALLLELSKLAPNHKAFQDNLTEVQDDLKNL